MVLKEIWLTKLACGLVGSVVGVICYPAKTAREAAARILAGGLSSCLATSPTMQWLGWEVMQEGELNLDGILAVGGAWGFCGWFLLGSLAKTLDQIKNSETPLTTIIYYVRYWKAPPDDHCNPNSNVDALPSDGSGIGGESASIHPRPDPPPSHTWTKRDVDGWGD